MSSINVQVNRNNNIISVGINSTGPQGQSAYETWLALGNVGTRQDFINSQFDEPARVTNENTRKANELIRIANENERIAAENIRQQQESSRQQEFEANEITRQTNETVRMSNEEARQEADILRGQTVEAIEQNYAPRLTSVEGQINDLATQMNTKPTEFAIPYINSIVAETDYKNTYFIDHLKIVHIIAYYKKSGTSDDITNTAQLFTLPVGYRPNSKVIAFAKCIMGTSPVSCDVSIGIDGIVRVYTPTGASYKFGEFDISFLGGN